MKPSKHLACLLLCGASAVVPVAAAAQSTTGGTCTEIAVIAAERRAGVYSGTPAAGYHGLQHRANFTIHDGQPEISGYPWVERVFCGSPAHRAGLHPGDVILKVNGRDGREWGVLAPTRPGLTFDLQVRRGDSILEFRIVTVARPPELTR